MSSWIEPTPAPLFTGAEQFVGLDATVVDFWSYAIRDLRTNTTRGLLAEWLVSRAVGATGVQPEWAAFDVLTPSGTKVEVKSSAYLQSWGQAKHSDIRFMHLKTRAWDPKTGEADERTFNADVYVFCLQTAREHSAYNPLDISQWAFYVLPGATVRAINQRSIGLRGVEARTTRVPYSALAAAIEEAATEPDSE